MITSLPDIQSFSETAPLLDDNIVISAYSHNRYYYPEHATPYLFLTNPLGKGHYFVNKNKTEICHKQFLFLNTQEKLAIRFAEETPLHTFLILFDDQFLSESINYYLTGEELLIDQPDHHSAHDFWLPNVPYAMNDAIRGKIAALQAQNDLSAEEKNRHIFEFIGLFIRENQSLKQLLRNVKATKRTTKEELYRRLQTAVELMNDNLNQAVHLDRFAQEACLNKFHFITSFKQVYGTTPHQYFRQLKLNKAYELLRQHKTVSEVCYALGFESVGSFSNLFRKQFGLNPSAVR